MQFAALLKDDLFFNLARHANAMALKLAQGIERAGYTFPVAPAANMLFPVLPDQVIQELQQSYCFYVWSRIDAQHSLARLVTSWATKEEAVDGFIADLMRLL